MTCFRERNQTSLRTRTLFLPSLSLLFVILAPFLAEAYNRPGCSDWPSEDVWDSELRNLLNESASLYGPFRKPAWEYTKACLLGEQSNVNILKGGRGVCMSNHVCANQFCDEFGKSNMPAYSIEVKSVADIQTALRFANEYNIGVSVKSTGHSFQSQSMQADSILLWLRHFPITNRITEDYIDSCETSHSTTIAVAAGESFDDVWRGTRNKYYVVSGNCQTVSLSGGWTQGGGLSLTSRFHGYGVDQAVSFDVVLADGSLVKADACTNSDLFWALRGGGGGNFGIVTNLEYKIYPATPITYLFFDFDGIPILELQKQRTQNFIRTWINFLVKTVPTTDRRWGGAWGPLQGRLFFVGTLEEALKSELIIMLDDWYDTEVVPLDPSFGRPSEIMIEYPSWYDFQGGEEAYDNPDFDFLTFSSPGFLGGVYSRIITVEVLLERVEELRDLLIDMAINKQIIRSSNYLLGGRTNDIGANATAMHPAMRRAVFEIESNNADGAERLRQFAGNDVGSVCYNHHSPQEPDWEEGSWGDNYPRLLEIKAKYDPNHTFNVYHGVGYRETVESPGCPVQDKKNVYFVLPILLSAVRSFFKSFPFA